MANKDEDYEVSDEASDSDFEAPSTSKPAKKDKIKVGKMKKSRKSSNSSSSTAQLEHLANIKQTFERFDVKQEGKLEVSQLKFAMRALGFEPKKEEIKRIIDQFGKDGFIGEKDFTDLMSSRLNEKNVNDEIMKAFQLFDSNHKGKITIDDLERVAEQLNENLSKEELQEMIDEADLNNDKAVDSQEFLRIMKKTCLY